MRISRGCAVIEGGDWLEEAEIRRYRVPISRAMGAREMAQAISLYSSGLATARRNPTGEEVHYVVRGSGACYIDGHRYSIEAGTGIYIPPGSVYQFENSEVGTLWIVSVCCPEDERSESDVVPVPARTTEIMPIRTIRESEVESIPTGDRSFKVLVDRSLGCGRLMQFVGVIPPGRAPMHHHSYEEAIYILEGEGRVWTENGDASFRMGTSIYLPRGVTHCLENTGKSMVRLMGVFHPSGSPAAHSIAD